MIASTGISFITLSHKGGLEINGVSGLKRVRMAEGLNVTIREAVSNGIFKGVSVGRNENSFSHLQYVDDTLIFGDWNMANTKNIMRIMECINLSSGLKINPNKTKVYGIGVGIEEVTSLAQRMRCAASLYGGDGGLTAYNEGIKRSGSTWSSIVKVGRVIDQSGVNFCSSFGRKMGNGYNTRFWLDKWVGENVALCGNFPRLFRLEIDKDISVGEKRCWRDGGWVWDWSWTRNPRGRAITELMKLTTLTNFCVTNVQLDSWSWLLDDKGIFTVKSLREKTDEATLNATITPQKTKWNTYIARKICISVWRLQQQRLPVRSWLHHIGMDLNTILCPHRD
ncbi:hypothetical protein Tco_1366966, partial [Tanacetum coccineum]